MHFSNEIWVISDNYDAEIPGAKPTPWLFYTGVDGSPGRYFMVKGVGLNGWWGRYPAYKPHFQPYPESLNPDFVKFCGNDCWHERLGTNIPSQLK